MLSTNDKMMAFMGIFVLLIALIGSAMLEGEAPEGEGLLFNVFFSEESEGVLDQDGHTNEDQTSSLELNVTHANITWIEFHLTWDDDRYPLYGDPNDEFELTIHAPDDTEVEYDPSSSESDTNENITIQAKLQELPEDKKQVSGESKKALAKELTTYVGIGTWNIEVTCNEAGDLSPIFNDDNGNDWNLEVTLYHYEASIEEVVTPTK